MPILLLIFPILLPPRPGFKIMGMVPHAQIPGMESETRWSAKTFCFVQQLKVVLIFYV